MRKLWKHSRRLVGSREQAWEEDLRDHNRQRTNMAKGAVTGMVLKDIPEDVLKLGSCPSCALTKAQHLPFNAGHTCTTKPLGLIHGGLVGLMPVESVGHCKYGFVLKWSSCASIPSQHSVVMVIVSGTHMFRSFLSNPNGFSISLPATKKPMKMNATTATAGIVIQLSVATNWNGRAQQ